MQKCVTIDKVLINVSANFEKAIWKEIYPSVSFTSVKEASKHYNLKNARYSITTDTKRGLTMREVNNAKIDGYGKRYN